MMHGRHADTSTGVPATPRRSLIVRSQVEASSMEEKRRLSVCHPIKPTRPLIPYLHLVLKHCEVVRESKEEEEGRWEEARNLNGGWKKVRFRADPRKSGPVSRHCTQLHVYANSSTLLLTVFPTLIDYIGSGSMSDSNDNFVVLEPQSENGTANRPNDESKLPTRPSKATRPNFLIITADSMLLSADTASNSSD